jgi:hypothetical protein
MEDFVDDDTLMDESVAPHLEKQPPAATTEKEQKLLDFILNREQADSVTDPSAKQVKPFEERKGNADAPPPGVTEPPAYWGLALIIIIILGAVGFALLGVKQRGELSTLFWRLTLRSTPKVILLESRQDKSLLLEIAGEHRRIIVQQSDRESWLLVSQDDFTAANPSLSPDGAWVAYLSTQNAPEIVIVPLENAERITYESADLATFGRRRDIDVASICDWTSIAWAADGEHLAFFGCAEDPPVSQVFVAELSPEDSTLTPSLITGTVASGVDPRQILWLGANQISVTFPPTKTTKVETVETFSIH